MSSILQRMLFVAVLVAFIPIPAESQVYNLHLATDNQPDYTDMKSFVQSATAAWQTPQEKAIAVWRWGRRSRRQTSCAIEDGRYIIDPILHYNSYGAMNCGIISSLNVSSFLELGYKARYIQLGDHTVSEVSWDDGKSWHLFDSSMSFYCFNHEGQIASCEEIKESHACELSGGKSEPGHYYFYHGAPQVVSHLGPAAWRFCSDQPVGYERTLANGADSYTDGFSVDKYCQYSRTGHRYTLNLRPFESYTRYWTAQDDAQHGGDPKTNDRDYFRPMANGSDPDDQHGLNNIRGNGTWVFQPDLAGKDRENLFYDSQNIAPAGDGPKVHPAQAGQAASVTYQITAANVITSLRIDATGLRKTEADTMKISVSRNAGIRWQPVWQADKTGQQPIQLTLRDEVAGVTECWVRFELLAAAHPQDAGLDALKITTITQVNRRALPALTLGSNQVLLRADEQLETVELWPALHAGKYKESIAEESDVVSADQPDGMYKATLGAAVNNKPCSVTWKLAVPSDIVDVAYNVISTIRSPRRYVSMQNSWDGRQFDEFARNDQDVFPADRKTQQIFSGTQVPAGTHQASFRAVFFTPNGAATYNMVGIQELLMRIHHKPRSAMFRPIEVTYNWTEHRETGDVTRSHTELVSNLPHRYTINTAGRRDPTMNWVRLDLQSPDADKTHYGYSDGTDVGPAFEYAKVSYQWGTCVSAGKPYTASRPSSAASGNPDSDGRELTNGIIIAPTDYTQTKAVQPATAFWDAGEPVTFVVDLGKAQMIAGARVCTHQPNAQFCHPATVEIAVSSDGQSWQPAGVIHHDDLWKPSGDYEAWEHDDSPQYASLPAAGRLAYRYPLAFKQPIQGRYVRFICTPLAGKGMGLSELEVYDRVEVRPWPGEIYLPR